MIPVNDEQVSESSSSSDDSQSESHSESEERSYSSDEGRGRRSGHKQGRSHSNRVQSKSNSRTLQCCFCAEYHDMSECMNRRVPGRYQQYENVRNRFAKDVGFNYRRGHESFVTDNSHGNHSQHHNQSRNYGGNNVSSGVHGGGHSRQSSHYDNRQYDDRRSDYHRQGSHVSNNWQDSHDRYNKHWKDSSSNKRKNKDRDNKLEHLEMEVGSKRFKTSSSHIYDKEPSSYFQHQNHPQAYQGAQHNHRSVHDYHQQQSMQGGSRGGHNNNPYSQRLAQDPRRRHLQQTHYSSFDGANPAFDHRSQADKTAGQGQRKVQYVRPESDEEDGGDGSDQFFNKFAKQAPKRITYNKPAPHISSKSKQSGDKYRGKR